MIKTKIKNTKKRSIKDKLYFCKKNTQNQLKRKKNKKLTK